MSTREAALARDDWIAINDTDFWFPPGCQRLLHVEAGTGMQDQHFDTLEARLRAARITP